MHPRSWIPAALLLFGATGLPAQGTDTLSTAERAQIISRVVTVRAQSFPDSARVDACSVSAGFGHDPAFAARLFPWPRRLLVGQGGPGCRTVSEHGLFPVWKLRRMDREHGYRVTVHATVYTPGGYHYETYDLRRTSRPGAPPEWAVERMWAGDFVISD